MALLLLLLVTGTPATNDPHEVINPVYRQLRSVGAGNQSTGDTTLPEPDLPDGVADRYHADVIESLPGRRQSVRDITNGKVTAPFVFRFSNVTPTDAAFPLRRVDVWFVMSGTLEDVSRREFAMRLVNTWNAREEVQLLEPGQLAARNISPLPDDDESEFYTYGTASLLDRVRVHTVTHTTLSRTEESVVVAGVIDPRFAEDAEFPSQWLPLTQKPGGVLEAGDPMPYTCAGYYTKVTRMKNLPDRLFVESHSIFHEPIAWFGGRSTLKSKLPLQLQAEIRSVRRRLLESSDAKR